MKTNLLKVALSAGCLCLGGLAVQAAPLQRADVPADPAWVAHLDCDGLRPTAIGQYVLEQMNKPEAQDKLAAFQSIFSFDLRTQLHGVTLYSTGAAPEDGVLVLYADFEPARLVTLAKAAKDAQNTNYKGRTIYSWLDDKKSAKDGVQPRVYAAIQGNRVIFAQREARVAQALDVLDGTSRTLAGSQAFAELGGSGSKHFIEAAARKFDLPASDPNAAIFRLSKLVRLQVGEIQRQATATLTLEANDEEVAGHIMSIAQGLMALMKLQQGKPEAAKLAQALQLNQNGTSVVANLALPAGDVVEMMKADAARKAAAAKKTDKE